MDRDDALYDVWLINRHAKLCKACAIEDTTNDRWLVVIDTDACEWDPYILAEYEDPVDAIEWCEHDVALFTRRPR